MCSGCVHEISGRNLVFVVVDVDEALFRRFNVFLRSKTSFCVSVQIPVLADSTNFTNL